MGHVRYVDCNRVESWHMELLRKMSQIVMGIALAFAGIAHLAYSRAEFQAQVPTFLHGQADFVVLASGVVEIVLGAVFGAEMLIKL